jgi:excinuclease UvrABC nuclease subunit
MKLTDLKANKLPDGPGVYFFKRKSRIIYIGKATSLKDRVRSYFNPDLMEARGPKLVQMLAEATTVVVEPTNSVLEALLKEAALIKKWTPIYNTREKDDKSFWYIVLTNEDFPRILLERGKSLSLKYEASEIKELFGPYPSGSEITAALKIIRRIFPFRDKCLPCGVGFYSTRANRSTDKKVTENKDCQPCFNRQLGLCPGVCSGEITAKDYQKMIGQLRLFLNGHFASVLKKLESEMKAAARGHHFEKAARLRDQIFSLNHIHDVSLLKRQSNLMSGFRIEAYDIAHLSGTNNVGVMTVVIAGLPDKSQYRRFKIKGDTKNEANDVANLKEVLRRRFTHEEWPLPDLLVVDGSIAQVNGAEAVLREYDLKIPIIAVTKNKKHKPESFLGDMALLKKYQADIILANAEAHRFAVNYHRHLRDRVL